MESFYKSFCSFSFNPDKPSRPSSIEAVEVRANHIKVTWNKPSDNGGSEITGYVIEKMDLETGRWIPAGEVKHSFIFIILIVGQ